MKYEPGMCGAKPLHGEKAGVGEEEREAEEAECREQRPEAPVWVQSPICCLCEPA